MVTHTHGGERNYAKKLSKMLERHTQQKDLAHKQVQDIAAAVKALQVTMLNT
jgi:hypothetical protein